jgi:hypothetical protein
MSGIIEDGQETARARIIPVRMSIDRFTHLLNRGGFESGVRGSDISIGLNSSLGSTMVDVVKAG